MELHPLFYSLDAWRTAKEFVAEAKKAKSAEDKWAFERLAGLWMADHEIFQAIYWAGVRVDR